MPRRTAPSFALRPLLLELRQLVLLGGPLALTQMGQSLLGVVDVAVLGHAGPVLLGGAGLGNALFFGIGVLGMGVMHGLDPLVSQALGAGDPGRARRLVWQGAWLACALAALLAVPIALAPWLLEPLGIAHDVAAQAGRFLSWRILGLPFFFLYFAPRAYLQARNRVAPMLGAVLVANAANLGLDLLLVFGGATLPAWAGPLRQVPALGVVGAAMSSNVASLLQAGLLALAVRADLRGARGGGPARPDPRALALALRVGLPAGLHMFAEVSFFSLASLVAGRLGALPLAAHQVALQLASLTFTATVGLGNAASVRVGLAVGARDRAGARRAGQAALLGAAGFMTCAALLFLSVPHLIARLMTSDPAIIAAAVPLIRIAALFELSDGLQGVGAGILRGAGEAHFTFAANMVAYWVVGLPLVLLLVFGVGLGIAGMWLGFVLSLALVAGSLVWRFLRVSSREIAPLAGHGA
jgi:MATE family multidrug resistance protein